MTLSENKWFEIWFDEGVDVLPNWLLIVTPDPANHGLVVVYDPFEKRVIHSGDNYDDTSVWLAEDEFELVTGRMHIEEYFGGRKGT